METASKKRRMFFRAIEKVKLYWKTDLLKAYVYLAEIDMYEAFSPKRGLYKTNEARVKALTMLGLKKKAIELARLFSLKENNFLAHQLLVKTLVHFNEFAEAAVLARSFTERHISKKYKNLLAMALNADYEHGKKRTETPKVSLVEHVRSGIRFAYLQAMTSSAVVRLRVWVDLNFRAFRKARNRWQYRLTRTIFFWRRSERGEDHVDRVSEQESPGKG